MHLLGTGEKYYRTISAQETKQNKQTNKQANKQSDLLTLTVSCEKSSCLIRSKKEKKTKPKIK